MFWNKKKSKFKCSVCGEIHSDWPALTFETPVAYQTLEDHQKKFVEELNPDFCVLNYGDRSDRFIRAVLMQKVIETDKELHYGLWVSLSDKSYMEYLLNFNDDEYEGQYFGWLNSELPAYECTLNIPTTVFVSKGRNRPEIVPYDDFDHGFVRDYYASISTREVESRIHAGFG